MAILSVESDLFTVLPGDPKPTPPDDAGELRRLVTQFRDKPRIVALIQAFAEQTDEFGDALFAIREGRWLDDAEGAQLDGLGRILVLPRGSWNDDEYRARLRVRIRILLADGTPEDIIQTLILLAGHGNPIQLYETFPAELRIVIDEAMEAGAASAVVDTALSIKPPGVRLWVEYGVEEPGEDEFAFAGGDDGAGFGEGVFRGVSHG